MVVISALWKTQNTEFKSLLNIILQLQWKNPKALKSFGDYLGEHPYFTVEKSELKRSYNVSTAKESVNPLSFTTRATGSEW